MKKVFAILLCAGLVLGLLSGCGRPGQDPGGRDGELRIVATIFPVYDWVRNVLGDRGENAQLTLLLDTGVDLHSYRPTAEDIVRIGSCDLFLYVGGESDEWVEDVLRTVPGDGPACLDLMEALGGRALPEETVEGMETEAEEGEGQEAETDEHIWLSLKNAAVLTRAIAEALGRADPAGKETYAANAEAYVGKLEALDAEYREAAETGRVRTLLFGDRFPFRYLTEDYGLSYYAAFLGCSAESEASFETVVFLAKKADELGLRCILELEGSDGRIARTVRDNTAGRDQEILALDSMQNVTGADAAAGADYLAIMRQNLAVLRTALE